MKDGLYRVVTPTFVAGFVVKNGRVVQRAPRLKRWTIEALVSYGVWICK